MTCSCMVLGSSFDRVKECTNVHEECTCRVMCMWRVPIRFAVYLWLRYNCEWGESTSECWTWCGCCEYVLPTRISIIFLWWKFNARMFVYLKANECKSVSECAIQSLWNAEPVLAFSSSRNASNYFWMVKLKHTHTHIHANVVCTV